MAPWRPLLDGERESRAHEVIDAIAREVDARARQASGSPALADGDAGLAVLFTYLATAFPGAGHEDRALFYLERALDGAPNLQAGLFSGVAGVAWAAEHLRGRLLDPVDDPVGDAAEGLLEVCSGRGLASDLSIGLAGIGVFALERSATPAGRALLARVVASLAAGARPAPGGLGWGSLHPPEIARHDLGVAHGVAGVTAFLAGAIAAGLGAEARPLLEGAVGCLLAGRLPEGGDTRFPAEFGAGGPPVATRTAWCYGDPGVAAALLLAGRANGTAAWVDEALVTARLAALRPMERAGAVDAGLCHGAAGLGHVFNRLFQATAEPRLAEAAIAWFDRALAMQSRGEGIAGYRALHLLPHGVWVDDMGLLTGAAGIALALLAAITPIEPAWDRALLLSLKV